jgi:hypothetical protein
MDKVYDYLNGYLINSRKYFPEQFNYEIAQTNCITFGLTSLITFFFHEPLAYLFFLIILTSTEADANLSGNITCTKFIRKLDVIIILIIIVELLKKTGKYYSLFLIPIILVHHWKRDATDKNDYEIRMNVWHSVATITTILVCTLYSILN